MTLFSPISNFQKLFSYSKIIPVVPKLFSKRGRILPNSRILEDNPEIDSKWIFYSVHLLGLRMHVHGSYVAAIYLLLGSLFEIRVVFFPIDSLVRVSFSTFVLSSPEPSV